MSSKQRQTGRRQFLKQIVRFGAGGAILAAAQTGVVEPPAERAAPPAKHSSHGYRVTPHVQTYYKKAAI